MRRRCDTDEPPAKDDDHHTTRAAPPRPDTAASIIAGLGAADLGAALTPYGWSTWRYLQFISDGAGLKQ